MRTPWSREARIHSGWRLSLAGRRAPPGPAQHRHDLARARRAGTTGAVEVEIAVDEAVKVVALLQADGVGCIAQPAVELGADPVEVLRLRTFLAFADFGGVLAAEPGFEAVGLDFLASVI